MADEALANFFLVTQTGQRPRIVLLEYQAGDENLSDDQVRELIAIVERHSSPRATVQYLGLAESAERLPR